MIRCINRKSSYWCVGWMNYVGCVVMEYMTNNVSPVFKQIAFICDVKKLSIVVQRTTHSSGST